VALAAPVAVETRTQAKEAAQAALALHRQVRLCAESAGENWKADSHAGTHMGKSGLLPSVPDGMYFFLRPRIWVAFRPLQGLH
jgi:hypothetical protein